MELPAEHPLRSQLDDKRVLLEEMLDEHPGFNSVSRLGLIKRILLGLSRTHSLCV